jgi:hypothetical protein
MDSMKAPDANSMVDRVAAQPDVKQLPPSDHAVLPRRQLRDQPIDWAL